MCPAIYPPTLKIVSAHWYPCPPVLSRLPQAAALPTTVQNQEPLSTAILPAPMAPHKIINHLAVFISAGNSTRPKFQRCFSTTTLAGTNLIPPAVSPQVTYTGAVLFPPVRPTPITTEPIADILMA